MRFAPLLVLVAILLSLAPADFATADCGPGSPPDCTCIGNTEPFAITYEQPAELLLPLSATFGNLTLSGGEVHLIANNNYPGLSTISQRYFEPITSVTVINTVPFSLGSYNYNTYVAPEPIPIFTVTTLAPTPSLPFPTPTTYLPPESNGVLSVELVNSYIPTWSSGVTLNVLGSTPPAFTSTSNFSVYYSSYFPSEIFVPEPTSLALVALALAAASAIRRTRMRH